MVRVLWLYLEINIQSCECQKSRTLSCIYCTTIKEGISHFGLILSTPSFVSLLFFLAGTLRSLPVQVRLLLVLATAGWYAGNALQPWILQVLAGGPICSGQPSTLKEQDPMVLPPYVLCLPFVYRRTLVENNLIREMRKCRSEGNRQTRPSNKSLFIKQSQGPLVLPQWP